MPEVIIYSVENPKGLATVLTETPVGVEVTSHNPLDGKTKKVTKNKGDRN